ncbi:hypothetical protein FRC96_09475 [Lujinxingia vulgaris]|uniref:RNA polymerase sigma factor 70 region 1.1 domain-containing protein n=1 Tax=Lujinxingia vulgaris TaxID=2600176 RepID=A0A5C6X9C1_9DELT|nr:RNA polymerase sigma factor region1.1 domain-containing protein [Lujinxingia vulgaris]TXD36301.1 hypothetical protein FRC96_09475 [Lujinxingia vulgaris]
MVEQNEFESNPEKTAYHDNKRELLRRGREKGELSWSEILEALPQEHLGEVEMEVFLFTCRQMGIEVKGAPS